MLMQVESQQTIESKLEERCLIALQSTVDRTIHSIHRNPKTWAPRSSTISTQIHNDLS
jgi:hypothetical protein